ncbi:DUF3617 domain-containing protein [Phenylobacterium sp.]|jgi:hypothetical protein|uniref:DUF3617 domain-containing protein n=1 Tax=Phenylobacterium sp. TaxID=1871053 RepID=UPI002F421DE1
MIRRAGLLITAAALAAMAGCHKKPAEAPAPAAAPSAGSPVAQAPASTTAAAAPFVAPRRKPGLWEQTISMAQMKQSTRLCVDQALEDKMGWWGQQAARDMCSKSAFTRGLDGSVTFASSCDMGASGHTVTRGKATGDFSSAYKVEMVSTTTGAATPQMNGEHRSVVEAAWKGPCPAGMKGGDMVLPGGMKMNLLDMAAATRK